MNTPIAEFTEHSVTELARRGVTVEHAETMGVRPVLGVADLPEQFQGLSYAPVPGMLFPWRHPTEDTVTWQYRPDHPVLNPETGSKIKYVFGAGEAVRLALTKAGSPTGPVLVVEGTLQNLAVARYAEPDVTVYGITGCWGWSAGNGLPTELLAVVEGRDVTVVLDADAASNPDVYSAGEKLGDALRAYGARGVMYSRLPVRQDRSEGKTAGVDDLIGSAPESARRGIVARIITDAKPKVSDRKPPGRSRPQSMGSDNTGLLEPNDTAIATTWADANAERFRWLADDEAWMRFRLGRWEETGASVVGSSVGLYLDGISQAYRVAAKDAKDGEQARELLETSRMLLSDAKLRSVRSRASMYDAIHVQREELDQHPRLWNAGNGVLDLMDGEFRAHDPGLLLTTGSDVIYDPDATSPRFDEFLADILPDADVREFMFRLFGVAMFGEVRANAQIFPVLIGEGRNGKGALIRIMEKLFGRHAVKVEAATLIERKFEAHSQEVIKLRGKRLATAEETSRNARWNTSRIKSWTGGDMLVGRGMHQNDQEFVPSHTLVMSTNHRPNVATDEGAFWMRYREIPFNISVEGREDPTLEPHIMSHELPGVLNRLLAGVRAYLADGLAAPEAVLVATEEARADTNHLARFAEETLVRTDHEEDTLLCSEVYDRARKWWSQNVDNQPIPADRGRNNFNVQLGALLGFVEASRNPRKSRVSGSIQLTWHGLRWLNGGSPDPLPLSPLPGTPITATPPTPVASTAPNASTAPAPVADIPGPVADIVAEINDLEISEPPGDTLDVAVVAVVADIEQHVGAQEEKTQGRGVTGQYDVCVSGARAAVGAYRQHGNTDTPVEASTPPVVFDLETADADQLHDHPDPRTYVRIAGRTTSSGVVVEPGPDAIVEQVLTSRRVIGHNILHFDLPALARVEPKIDLLAMTRDRRVLDTMVTESVLHPILNDKSAGAVARAAKHFALDATAARYGLAGKTDEAKRLAKQHGGFDQIPVDDEEYVSYCRGDVEATKALAGYQAAEIAQLPKARQDYLWREHRVHAIAAQMGMSGFLVDEPLLQRRFWLGYGRKNDLGRELIARYDLPTVKADGKPAESPAATKAGKAAILAAFASLGVDVDAMEKTPKGAIAFGGNPMKALAETYAEHPNGEEIGELADLVADVAGVRTVYGTALESLRADGRVHPEVATFQASGRWSVRKPGLTVFGKRKGRKIERAVFRAAQDYGLFTIDLSQIDARAIAVHSQDHAYMDLFLPGRDAHEIFGRMVWGDAVYDSDPLRYRDQIKGITHGMPYGMQAPRMAEHAGVPIELAQKVFETRRERFPRLVEWEAEIREEGASGRPLDNGFGRKMVVDPERAFTQSVALMGQGTARDLMMKCLLDLPDYCARMLRAQVHDEAVFEVPLALAGDIVPRIERAFNFSWAPDPSFRPINVEAEAGQLGTSWADCY